MLFATVGQGARFVWMLAAGAGVGAWYMLTALLRRFIQAGFWLTLACDLLFGVGAAVILIAALIAHEWRATENPEDGFFSAKSVEKWPDLNDRIAAFSKFGQEMQK